MAALPLILWPPHRLAQVALDAAVQSVRWRNVLQESTGTVQFITTQERLLKHVKQHFSVASYEAEAVAAAVHQQLLEPTWLDSVVMLPEVCLHPRLTAL